jgi:hypothetical protein
MCHLLAITRTNIPAFSKYLAQANLNSQLLLINHVTFKQYLVLIIILCLINVNKLISLTL